MKLLIRGGLFVISSPLDYFIKVNKELGFREVPEAGHAEFGQDLWSADKQILFDWVTPRHPFPPYKTIILLLLYHVLKKYYWVFSDSSLPEPDRSIR